MTAPRPEDRAVLSRDETARRAARVAERIRAGQLDPYETTPLGVEVPVPEVRRGR